MVGVRRDAHGLPRLRVGRTSGLRSGSRASHYSHHKRQRDTSQTALPFTKHARRAGARRRGHTPAARHRAYAVAGCRAACATLCSLRTIARRLAQPHAARTRACCSLLRLSMSTDRREVPPGGGWHLHTKPAHGGRRAGGPGRMRRGAASPNGRPLLATLVCYLEEIEEPGQAGVQSLVPARARGRRRRLLGEARAFPA